MFRIVFFLLMLGVQRTNGFSPTIIKNRLHLSDGLAAFKKSPMYSTTHSMQHMTMSLKEGDCIPSVIFKARVRDNSLLPNPFKWKDVQSEDLFQSKRSVVFALPGAFTPTCSSTHLPGYEMHYGIDEVYCLSVNDAFVMRQWGIHQGLDKEDENETNPLNPGNFKKVKLIPDGAALFTRGMGMSCVWESERGFGERSWRYSAVINDMKIEKLFVEAGAVVPNSGPDPFEVSDASTMVNYLKSVRKEQGSVV